MFKYVCFLRAVNVGGKNRIVMNELKLLFENLGFESVETFIQSGNVKFTSFSDNTDYLSELIQTSILEKFSLNIICMILTTNDLNKISTNVPLNISENMDENNIYVGILSGRPENEKVSKLILLDYSPDKIIYNDGVLYLYVSNSFSNSKFTGKLIEKVLERYVTFRKFTVLKKLTDK